MKLPVYAVVATVGTYRIVRHPGSSVLYVSWYDADARQTRRRSLKTTDVVDAIEMATSFVDRKITGDPIAATRTRSVSKVRQLMEWHQSYVETLPSASVEGIQVKQILASVLADRRVASLDEDDFDQLRDAWLAEGLSIGTVSRRLSTLRSAISRAVKRRLLDRAHAPMVPEYRKKAHIRLSPPKGAPCEPVRLARLYDHLAEPHSKVFFAILAATGARSGSVLDFCGVQIDWSHLLIDLNPAGRLQTGKYRPILPMIAPLREWASLFPVGPVVQWRGQPMRSAKSGWRKAVAGAQLPRSVNSYSLRHGLGRYLRAKGVSTEEIAVWLGHAAPAQNAQITLIYSPYAPDYLAHARAATEEFFLEIAANAKTDLATPSLDVVAYFARLRSLELIAEGKA